MANNRKAVLTFAVQGMNGSIHPAAINMTGVVRAVNCQIKGSLLTTRPGFKAHKLGPDAEAMRGENIQGALHYNPVLGQSQRYFGENRDSLMVVAGGRKFHITIGPSKIVSVSDETNDIFGVRDAHLAWLFQAENYVIAQDGSSRIWIWDGNSSAFTSPGYNTKAPEKSRLANGGSAGTYAHGRIVQVILGNKIIVGDIIHKTRFGDPANILRTSEQVYYATGSFFSPPSNMGEVVAIGLLPLSNTMHGHDDVVVHCRRGIFSLKLDHSPRIEWITRAVSKHLLLDTAAAGPYALILYDGDQMFRSRNGIQTIRSAAANANILGNPNQPISEPVASWLDADHQGHLKFCSMAKWPREHRIFCTTGLWAKGRWRGGTGMVVLNMNPDGSVSPETRAWEGLWTLPRALGKPSQIINAQFADEDRLFVLSTSHSDCDTEFRNSLLECRTELREDEAEDGTTSRISCQVILGQYPVEEIYNPKHFHDGKICFVGVTGKLDWGVWGRIGEGEPWVLWSRGTFLGTEECDVADDLASPKQFRITRNLGEPPREIRKGHTIQLLLRWRGWASVESVAVGYEDEAGNATPEADAEKMVETAPCGDYSDYEYTIETERWESQ